MRTLYRCFLLAALAAALVPATARAQFFGGPSYYSGYGGGYGFGGGWGGGWGSPYGGWGSPYGGWGYGGWGSPFGGWVTGPTFYTTPSYVQPIVYTVTTPPSARYQRDVPIEPRERPAVWPAIPWRATALEGTQARIDVRLPAAAAEVWFDGVLTQQTGIDRHFITPALDAGATYTFEIRASWRDPAGKEVTRTRRIDVRAGEVQVVDFVAAR